MRMVEGGSLVLELEIFNCVPAFWKSRCGFGGWGLGDCDMIAEQYVSYGHRSEGLMCTTSARPEANPVSFSPAVSRMHNFCPVSSLSVVVADKTTPSTGQNRAASDPNQKTTNPPDIP